MWSIDPVYRGCETVREYVVRWGSYAQRFDRKRDAVAFTLANPNGPPIAPRLQYIDGKRVWK